MTSAKNPKTLGLFSLVMIAIVSVDSLRNLPIGAQYGFPLVTLYFLAGLMFFLPLTWVAAKLAAFYPNTGGSYVWVEKAFGTTISNLSLWLLWIYNLIWYPTIFVFITTTLASLIFTDPENHKWFILLTSLGLFWLISFIHSFGIRANSWISYLGAIIGTLSPMVLIIGLAFYWLTSNPSATSFNSWDAFLPNANTLKNLAFFSNILFSLLGLEVIAIHAGNVKDPRNTYPRAFLLSAIIILITLTFSSLALCIIRPAEEIALTSGLMDVFKQFFHVFKFPFAESMIGACIIIGGLAIASSWMFSLARSLHVALMKSGQNNHWLKQCNQNEMPTRILFINAFIYTILLGAFLLFPNINNSYWILSALTTQFALLYYVILFCAAIKLLQEIKQSVFNRLLNIVLPCIASLVCLFGIVIGFLPPEQIPAEHTTKYIVIMMLSFIAMCYLPVVLTKLQKKRVLINLENESENESY